MPRTKYALPIDATRRFDPTITQTDLDSDDYLGAGDRETITARLEGMENQFERDTGTALREVRVGSQGDSATYEYLEAKRSLRFPVVYTLDHKPIHPIDSAQGDKIEVRTSRDSWDDITADEGSRWVLIDNRSGKLEFYSRLRHTIQFRIRPGVRFLRVSYRYGGLGGDPTSGGQTTLSDSVASSDETVTNLSVSDASRLPNEGGVMLLNGSEYVRVTNVDTTNNEVDISARGLRRTGASQSHSSGDVLHYCPMHVREAIAAQTAVELAQIENFADRLIDTGDSLDLSQKIDQWETEYQNTVARYAQWGKA